MKNQYFGDHRDFCKFDLLLDLVAAIPQPRLTYIPMLTPDDDTREGRLTAYSEGARRSALRDAFQTALRDGTRDVRFLRDIMASYGIHYRCYREDAFYADETRREYTSGIPSEWLTDSVVFFDPDIGLEPAVPRSTTRANSAKYLRYDDLRSTFKRGTGRSVFVVYQHLQRNAHRREGDINGVLQRLRVSLSEAMVWAVQSGDLAFFIATRERQPLPTTAVLTTHARVHGMTLYGAASDVGKMSPMAEPLTSLEAVVTYLNRVQTRATYGAVAAVTGGIARGIGARLSALYSRSPEASWVVSAETGLPSGYSPSERHPALLNNPDIITDGVELRRRLAGGVASTSAPKPQLSPRLAKPASPQPVSLSVDELSTLRRQLMAILDRVDTSKSAVEGIRKRINRLSQPGGPIPRHIAALMATITEMRNSAEYESKRLTESESSAVRHAWQAIREWSTAL